MLVELDTLSLGSYECRLSNSFELSPSPSVGAITLQNLTDFLLSREADAMSLSSCDHETAHSYLE